MAIRTVMRRGQRRLVIDIRFENPDGTPGRFRRDAEVQTLAAARAEERRRLLALAQKGSVFAITDDADVSSVVAAPDLSREAGSEVSAQAPRASFEDVVEGYLGDFAVSHLKPSTRTGYEKVIRGVLLPQFARVPIDRIDAPLCRQLDAQLVRRKLSVATRHHVLSVLRSILRRYAVEAGYLARPPELPKLPKLGRTVLSVLSTEQVEALLEAAGPRYQLAFLIAADAGLRAGEVRALKWRDIDLANGLLVVRESTCHGITSTPKSGSQRVVPLTARLKRALEAVNPRPPEQHVTRSPRGEPWPEFALGHAFRRTCAKARLTGWSLHDLRHYFVTTLFRAGVPAPTVQALAGHVELSTTQRYAHVIPADLCRAIERMAAVSGGTARVTGG